MLEDNMRVRCYYNLAKRCISVQHKGIVVAHASDIVLEDVKFIVQQGGRNRVLKTRQKNVHAFVEGNVIQYAACDLWKMVSYNPYLFGTFYLSNTFEAIFTAKTAYVTNRGAWVNASENETQETTVWRKSL